ncbi:MAG: GNAT family N-acetyltransferase [Clostridia bacterium]|nr:GNAT family N-acetyltransferase [Clostridia bacterium]
MIIETARLIIREYTMDDFDGLYEILSDAETMKYYPRPYDENGTRRWINWCLDSYRQNGFGLWALELKDTGAFIGDCGISMQNIDGEMLPEIGYHVNKKYWRRGYAKEASAAVRDWLFENTDFDCVYSYMNQENLPSYATAEANGMTRIKAYQDDEEALFVYAITRKEWEAAQSSREK